MAESTGLIMHIMLWYTWTIIICNNTGWCHICGCIIQNLWHITRMHINRNFFPSLRSVMKTDRLLENMKKSHRFKKIVKICRMRWGLIMYEYRKSVLLFLIYISFMPYIAPERKLRPKSKKVAKTQAWEHNQYFVSWNLVRSVFHFFFFFKIDLMCVVFNQCANKCTIAKVSTTCV